MRRAGAFNKGKYVEALRHNESRGEQREGVRERGSERDSRSSPDRPTAGQERQRASNQQDKPGVPTKEKHHRTNNGGICQTKQWRTG